MYYYNEIWMVKHTSDRTQIINRKKLQEMEPNKLLLHLNVQYFLRKTCYIYLTKFNYMCK
jgi:hypothetical protein